MALRTESLRLYLVTDPTLCPGPKLVDTVAAAVRGGVSFVQLRDKHASPSERVEAARVLKAALEGLDVPIVVNDDVDAAIAADVDGVHVGQGDVDPAMARMRLGPRKIVGLSCSAPEHVETADGAVVDYLGLGTVFPTSTKGDCKPSIGLSGLADLARRATAPSVAIGGLKAEHAAGVLRAGCHGLAVVSAICGQADPERAAKEMRRAIDGAEKTRI